MFEIPEERLPPGFARTVDEPPVEPVEPRPAATVVVLRDGPEGLETLLMRRHRSSGFVPGAWVFPGGRVDPEDGSDAAIRRVRGLAPEPRPAAPFWVAALRELFEETGVLLARDGRGAWSPDASSEPRLEQERLQLMEGRADIAGVLDRQELSLDVELIAHIAHWVTPVVESRRYDTHFFAAALPEGRTAVPDPREMTESVWLRPDAALDRFAAGALPMVFPTLKTLEALVGYDGTEGALRSLHGRTVQRILPRLVRTDSGVGIVIDD